RPLIAQPLQVGGHHTLRLLSGLSKFPLPTAAVLRRFPALPGAFQLVGASSGPHDRPVQAARCSSASDAHPPATTVTTVSPERLPRGSRQVTEFLQLRALGASPARPEELCRRWERDVQQCVEEKRHPTQTETTPAGPAGSEPLVKRCGMLCALIL